MIIFPGIFRPYIEGRELAIASNWRDLAQYTTQSNANIQLEAARMDQQLDRLRYPGLRAAAQGESDAMRTYGAGFFDAKLANAMGQYAANNVNLGMHRSEKDDRWRFNQDFPNQQLNQRRENLQVQVPRAQPPSQPPNQGSPWEARTPVVPRAGSTQVERLANEFNPPPPPASSIAVPAPGGGGPLDEWLDMPDTSMNTRTQSRGELASYGGGSYGGGRGAVVPAMAAQTEAPSAGSSEGLPTRHDRFGNANYLTDASPQSYAYPTAPLGSAGRPMIVPAAGSTRSLYGTNSLGGDVSAGGGAGRGRGTANADLMDRNLGVFQNTDAETIAQMGRHPEYHDRFNLDDQRVKALCSFDEEKCHAYLRGLSATKGQLSLDNVKNSNYEFFRTLSAVNFPSAFNDGVAREMDLANDTGHLFENTYNYIMSQDRLYSALDHETAFYNIAAVYAKDPRQGAAALMELADTNPELFKYDLKPTVFKKRFPMDGVFMWEAYNAARAQVMSKHKNPLTLYHATIDTVNSLSDDQIKNLPDWTPFADPYAQAAFAQRRSTLMGPPADAGAPASAEAAPLAGADSAAPPGQEAPKSYDPFASIAAGITAENGGYNVNGLALAYGEVARDFGIKDLVSLYNFVNPRLPSMRYNFSEKDQMAAMSKFLEDNPKFLANNLKVYMRNSSTYSDGFYNLARDLQGLEDRAGFITKWHDSPLDKLIYAFEEISNDSTASPQLRKWANDVYLHNRSGMSSDPETKTLQILGDLRNVGGPIDAAETINSLDALKRANQPAGPTVPKNGNDQGASASVALPKPGGRNNSKGIVGSTIGAVTARTRARAAVEDILSSLERLRSRGVSVDFT
jgi:hypothetical protein